MSNSISSLEQQHDQLQSLMDQVTLSNQKEQNNNSITLQENKERSTSATTCYNILNGKNIIVGEFQCFGGNTKAMLMSSSSSYGLFEKVDGGKFPNEKLIVKNLTDYNSKRTISFIFPGPTYEDGDLITGLAIDNGASVGQSIDLNDDSVKGKGLLYIENGVITLTHTTEVTQEKVNTLIKEKRDICTLPSIKRNGVINSKLIIETTKVTKNARFIVKMKDGSIGTVVLKNCTAEQQIDILSDDKFSRVLYCDGVGNKGQMDGGRKEMGTSKQLVYENHTLGNGAKEVKGNMPAVFVVYTE